MTHRAHTVCRPILAALCFLWLAGGAAAAQKPPFAPGEALTYELRWTIVPAGTGVLRVLPMTTIDGKPAWHFQLTARSNAFIDPFYKVRDTIDAYADPAMNHSVHYHKAQHEGSTQRTITVSFDWAHCLAHYHKVEKEGTSDKETHLMEGTFDPLSSFYYVRGLDPGTHPRIERPITDGNKNVIGEVRVIRRETIRVSGRDWDTYLVEPDLRHIGGVFKKSKNATIKIWITADYRHIPVRLESRVVVGSFVADLISAKGLTH